MERGPAGAGPLAIQRAHRIPLTSYGLGGSVLKSQLLLL